MVTLSRKQREIQERETQILRLARPILLREGYQALSMERLASMMEYAKGTLYNHFPNKEEIVLALAIESMELRYQFFEVAASEEAPSRHRLMAIGSACELYTQRFQEHFAIEEWIRNSTIWDKSSARRQDLIRQCEGRCVALVAAIVRDAVQANELTLANDMTGEEMIFGFWSINYGSQVLAATSPSLAALGIVNAPAAIRRHCYTLMEGFQWQPLMSYAEHVSLMDRFYQSLESRFASVQSQSVPR